MLCWLFFSLLFGELVQLGSCQKTWMLGISGDASCVFFLVPVLTCINHYFQMVPLISYKAGRETFAGEPGWMFGFDAGYLESDLDCQASNFG